MNTKNFIELLNNENAVRDVDLKQLDSVLENFPYFQSARMLYLRNLKINNNLVVLVQVVLVVGEQELKMSNLVEVVELDTLMVEAVELVSN